MTTRGPQPKPIEQRRLLGNLSKRALPTQGTIAIIDAPTSVPEPERPLGVAGRALWGRVWTHARPWLAHTDFELLQMVCEQVDERAALRRTVMAGGDWRQRGQLRALDAQIARNLGDLGLTPTERARLDVAEVKAVSKLEELRRHRHADPEEP